MYFEILESCAFVFEVTRTHVNTCTTDSTAMFSLLSQLSVYLTSKYFSQVWCGWQTGSRPTFYRMDALSIPNQNVTVLKAKIKYTDSATKSY